MYEGHEGQFVQINYEKSEREKNKLSKEELKDYEQVIKKYDFTKLKEINQG